MENFRSQWIPAWYALDQRIRKGAAAKFVFTKGERKFFTGMSDPQDTEAVFARIVSIDHPVLGAIDEVDTLGLSYWIWLGNDVIQVEAEEQPGKTERSTLKEAPVIYDFEMLVELEPALPSQVGELDMIAVMLMDEVSEFFKWWGYSLEDADDTEAVLNALLHYVIGLLKGSVANERELENVFRFIARMYEWGNPYIATMFDDNVLLPLTRVEGAEAYILQQGGIMQERFSFFKNRLQVLNNLWK